MESQNNNRQGRQASSRVTRQIFDDGNGVPLSREEQKNNQISNSFENWVTRFQGNSRSSEERNQQRDRIDQYMLGSSNRNPLEIISRPQPNRIQEYQQPSLMSWIRPQEFVIQNTNVNRIIEPGRIQVQSIQNTGQRAYQLNAHSNIPIPNILAGGSNIDPIQINLNTQPQQSQQQSEQPSEQTNQQPSQNSTQQQSQQTSLFQSQFSSLDNSTSQSTKPGSQQQNDLIIQVENRRQTENTRIVNIHVNPSLYPRLIDKMDSFGFYLESLNKFYNEHLSFNKKTWKLDFVQKGVVTRESMFWSLTKLLDIIRTCHQSTVNSGFFHEARDFDGNFQTISALKKFLFPTEKIIVENVQNVLKTLIEDKTVEFSLSLEDYAKKAGKLDREFDTFDKICKNIQLYLVQNPRAFSSKNPNRYCTVNLIIFAILVALSQHDQTEQNRARVIISTRQKALEALFWQVLDDESLEKDYLESYSQQWENYRVDKSLIQ